MTEPTWHLAFQPMPPRPGEPDAARRVARLLKFALRALRLRCVSLKELPPDPTAYQGWVRPDGWRPWVRVCSAATPELCEKLLAEAGLAGLRRVSPKGQVPGEGEG